MSKNIRVLDHCVNDCKHRTYELKEDGSNSSEFYKPDMLELDGPEFKNFGGYPRNEVAIINEQQSVQVMNALADRLAVVPDDTKLESNVSDAELRLSLRSRYAQTPSEQIAYTEEMLRLRDERLASKRDKAEKAAAAKKLQDEKDELFASLTNEERQELIRKKREKQIDSLLEG